MPKGVYPRLRLRGEHHYASKLTNDKVRLIRKSSDTSDTLAKQFGVSTWTVHDVRTRRTWAHVGSGNG